MKLVTREQWGARKRKGSPSRLSTDLVTVHWEGPRMGVFSHDKCAGKVRGIQAFHMDPKPRGRGWQDAAYSAIACPHGYVFALRGPGVRTGANGTNEGNTSAHAVCALVGEGDPITEPLLDAIADAVVWLGGRRVNAHRDWKPTACPGDELTGHVRAGRFTPSGGIKPPTTGELSMSDVQTILDRLDQLEEQIGEVRKAVVINVAEGLDDATEQGPLARVIGSIKGYTKARALYGLSPEQADEVVELAKKYDPTAKKPG